MNLVQNILETVGGETLGKLAGVLGADKDETQQAVGAAVPALLAGIGSLVSKPEGAEKVWTAVQGVDDTILGNLNHLLGGDKPDVLENMGGGLLEGLFGKGMLATIIGALGSYLGGKTNLISKLLPILAPVVMGMLSKQVKSGGLDLGGLAKLLLGQKDNIARAMPAGLANQLSGVQGLGDVSGFLSGAVDKATAAAAASRPPATTSSQSSPMGWLIPLIAVLAIGGLVWSMMQNRSEVADDVDKAVEDVEVDLGDATAQVGELTTNFKDLFGNMNDVLGNVTDAASARDALPKLQDMNTQLDTLSTTFKSVPASARSSLVTVIRNALTQLQEKKDAVLAIPGVGDILRPVLDEIVEKINTLLPA